jgi:hypothetical protein
MRDKGLCRAEKRSNRAFGSPEGTIALNRFVGAHRFDQPVDAHQRRIGGVKAADVRLSGAKKQPQAA